MVRLRRWMDYNGIFRADEGGENQRCGRLRMTAWATFSGKVLIAQLD